MVLTGQKHDEDKPLYLRHNFTFLPGTTLKTTSPGDVLEFIKKELTIIALLYNLCLYYRILRLRIYSVVSVHMRFLSLDA